MIDRLVWELNGQNWPNRAASRFVAAAGINWHVQFMEAERPTDGSGTRPSVLLVHGTGASTHSWRRLAPLLAQQMTVLTFDLPGHAFSEALPREHTSLPGMATATSELLRTLHFEPTLVIGHSAGAAVLARMCIDRTIEPRALVSLNGALLPFTGMGSQLLAPLAKLMAKSSYVPALFARHASDRNAVLRLLDGTGSKIPSEDIEFYALLTSCRSHVAGALAMMASWNLHPLAEDLGRLATPLTLVAGGDDRTIRPDVAFAVRDLVRGSSCIYLRGVGHLMHEEQPDEIAKIAVRTLLPRDSTSVQ